MGGIFGASELQGNFGIHYTQEVIAKREGDNVDEKKTKTKDTA